MRIWMRLRNIEGKDENQDEVQKGNEDTKKEKKTQRKWHFFDNTLKSQNSEVLKKSYQ